MSAATDPAEGVSLASTPSPTATAFQVPSEIIDPGDGFKFEKIVGQASANNTAGGKLLQNAVVLRPENHRWVGIGKVGKTFYQGKR